MPNNAAEILIKSGAYVNNWSDRDKWVSLPDGSEVPVYLSCRRLISNPIAKRALKNLLSDAAIYHFADRVETVIGLATAGIVWGDAVSEKLDVPFAYIRSGVKNYGLGKLVEGNPPEDVSALIVDDTLLTGESIFIGKRALSEEKSINTVGCLTIASLHGPGLSSFSNEIDGKAVALVDFNDICDAASEHKVLTHDQAEAMRSYYINPKNFIFDGI